MKFQLFSIATEESTDVGDTRRLAVFICTTDMEFVTLIPIEIATKGTDLYEEIRKCSKGGISQYRN
jgi:hypothetical protein